MTVVRAALTAAVLALVGTVVGCSPAPPAPPPTISAPTPTLTPTTSGEIPEPTTTNTLPPPPAPSAPAASTAGALRATSLPVPAGWTTAALPGGDEEGYLGNGTWVHALDPRYAALDIVTVGCADVTRDDYTDPSAALEGDYTDAAGDAGIGRVLDFAEPAAARTYFEVYLGQVRACAGGREGVSVSRLRTPVADDGGVGLVDRRRYLDDDQDWTEVVELNGARLTLLILGDPGHAITDAATGAILARIRP